MSSQAKLKSASLEPPRKRSKPDAEDPQGAKKKAAYPDPTKAIGNCSDYEIWVEWKKRQRLQAMQNEKYKGQCFLPSLDGSLFCKKIVPFLERSENLQLVADESLQIFGKLYALPKHVCVAHGTVLKEFEEGEEEEESDEDNDIVRPPPSLEWKRDHPSPNPESCRPCKTASLGIDKCHEECGKIGYWNEMGQCHVCETKYCSSGTEKCYMIERNIREHPDYLEPLARDCASCQRSICNNSTCLMHCSDCNRGVCTNCKSSWKTCEDCASKLWKKSFPKLFPDSDNESESNKT